MHDQKRLKQSFVQTSLKPKYLGDDISERDNPLIEYANLIINEINKRPLNIQAVEFIYDKSHRSLVIEIAINRGFIKIELNAHNSVLSYKILNNVSTILDFGLINIINKVFQLHKTKLEYCSNDSISQNKEVYS